MSATRILLVDDDSRIRRSLRRVLVAAGYDLSEADSFAAAKKFIRNWPRNTCDVVLLDLNLGDGYGADLLPDLESLEPAPRVAVVSGFLDDSIRQTICARCAVSLEKTIGTEALLREIEGMVEKRLQHQVIEKFARCKKLSPRETEVIRATLDGRNREEVAAHLHLSPGTVASYWQRILGKTGARSKREVFATVLRFQAESCQNCRRRKLPLE